MYGWLQGTFWGDKVLYLNKALNYTGGYMCENRSRRGIHGKHQQYFLAGQCIPGFTVSFFSQRPLVKHVHPNKDSITCGVILETLSDAHTFPVDSISTQNRTKQGHPHNPTLQMTGGSTIMLLSGSFSLWKRTRALTWVWMTCPTHHTHHCGWPSPVLIANDLPLRILTSTQSVALHYQSPKRKMGQ